MKEERSSKGRRLQYVALILLVVFLLSAVLLFVNIWERVRGDDDVLGTSDTTLVYNDEEYVLKDGIETVLILGLDKFEGEKDDTAYYNDKQSDFMMLLVIDNYNRKCTGIHINRDTMVEMDILGIAGESVGKVTQQAALAHTYGNGKEVSCRNAADAVSRLLLGVKIDHYISITMDAVPRFNDMVGGVEVEVLDDFTGIDDTLIKGETVTLMGEHALNYVRTRYGLEDSS
ncbi:MAG: LCP family protein, partial [Clostridia bacterium]|nr:LCP family protein [Clostridia bacterium]